MRMMRIDKKKIQWFQAGMLFLVLLLVHAFAQPDYGDDLTYADMLSDGNLVNLLKERYEWWSSRVVIEAVLIPLTTVNPWVWRILDTLMVVLLVYNAADLFGLSGERLQAQCIFSVLIWSVPLDSLSSAGWITTTANYLWPLALGVVAMRPLRNWLLERKCAPWEYVICPLCVIYAANMEQMGAILLGVYLVIGFCLFLSKKSLAPFYFVMLSLTALSLFLILKSPGNAYRSAAEAERVFPEFQGLTGGEKLLMGFIESAHYYIVGGFRQVSYLFPVLTGVLFLAMTENQKGRKRALPKLLTALCPLAFFWIVGHLLRFLFYGNYLTRGLNVVGFVVGLFGENRQLAGLGNYGVRQVALQAGVYLFLLACVAFTIFFLHGRSGETLLQLLILGAGFFSRVIVGFSSTIYASGDRTAIFASAAVLIVTLRNIQLYLRSQPRAGGRMVLLLYLALNIVCNLAAV